MTKEEVYEAYLCGTTIRPQYRFLAFPKLHLQNLDVFEDERSACQPAVFSVPKVSRAALEVFLFF